MADAATLAEWLAGPAGLSGKKLEAALVVCEVGPRTVSFLPARIHGPRRCCAQEEYLETKEDLCGMAESIAALEAIGFKKVIAKAIVAAVAPAAGHREALKTVRPHALRLNMQSWVQDLGSPTLCRDAGVG